MVEMRRPLIGVTGPDHGLPLAWWFTRWSVACAGGQAVRLNATNPDPPRALDGIIIGGGTDLDPALYSGMDDGKAPRDSRRDAFEKRMIEAAIEDLPFDGSFEAIVSIVGARALTEHLKHIAPIEIGTPFMKTGGGSLEAGFVA